MVSVDEAINEVWNKYSLHDSLEVPNSLLFPLIDDVLSSMGMPLVGESARRDGKELSFRGHKLTRQEFTQLFWKYAGSNVSSEVEPIADTTDLSMSNVFTSTPKASSKTGMHARAGGSPVQRTTVSTPTISDNRNQFEFVRLQEEIALKDLELIHNESSLLELRQQISKLREDLSTADSANLSALEARLTECEENSIHMTRNLMRCMSERNKLSARLVSLRLASQSDLDRSFKLLNGTAKTNEKRHSKTRKPTTIWYNSSSICQMVICASLLVLAAVKVHHWALSGPVLEIIDGFNRPMATSWWHGTFLAAYMDGINYWLVHRADPLICGLFGAPSMSVIS